MIRLGLTAEQKDAEVLRYCRAHNIQKVFLISPQKFTFPCSFENTEVIEWDEVIQYTFYYRLLQEIHGQTLIIVNECLRTQNRYDLTYNCIRNYLNQTKHQLVFQHLPLIDALDDFMILFDFDTRSRWKREKWNPSLLSESDIATVSMPVTFTPIEIQTDDATKAAYRKEKEKLIANIGLKDPHTIPRNLYLMSGKAKVAAVQEGQWYIGRNNRFKMPTLQTYKEDVYQHDPYVVFEFCHNFIDFADFLTLSQQSRCEVLVADLKVDAWYLDRYQQWARRIADAYSILPQATDRLRSVA